MKTKKRNNLKFLVSLFLAGFLILNISIINILAQNTNDSQNSAPSQDIPFVGKVNPETGTLSSSFEKFREASETLSKEELKKAYLKRKWTKIFAKSPIISAPLFYTEKFFSFFNPVWKTAFGIEFSWSWAFILSLILWIVLIIIVYSPSKAFANFNPFLTLIFAMIVATLAGSGGVIKKAVDLLSFAIKNIWILGLSILIGIIALILYTALFKQAGEKMKKDAEEEKLEKTKKTIKAHGELSEEALKEFEKD